MKTVRLLIAAALCFFAAHAQAALSAADIATLRPIVQAEPTLAQAVATGNDYAIADWLNASAAPDFIVWRTTTPIADVENAIAWANFTPSDSPDGTQTWLNRAIACQGKQFNLQIMIQGKTTISSGRANIRSGLQDALTNIPSGVGGALQSGGWGILKPVLTRLATRAEKALATGAGNAATPAALGFEGAVSAAEASLLR
jgi:hypothetical protein